jgi:serine/threonine protein kinase
VTGDAKNVKILQTVASGGTAVLYKALQVSLDRVVAVKRLHQHLTTDDNFTRRFILEAKAAASLDHENIVRVIDFGVEDGCYQIVMEFVEGESLKEILDRFRPIGPDLSLALVHQICRGLEHAHAKGIVHRDIKPGNVMVTRMGAVKITDFGLAKLTQGSSVQTAVDSILGTPLYMSPEQAFGESVDHRSDLFSLGTVLYELLTGKQPFASENYMGIIQNIIHLEIPNVCELNETVPENVEAIVAKALARNREERFQSARQFRETIESVLGLEGLNRALSRIPALLERTADTRLMSRPSTRPGSAGVPAWASTSSAMKRKRSNAPVWTAIGVVTLVGGSIAGYYFFGPRAQSLASSIQTPTPAVQGADLGSGSESNPFAMPEDSSTAKTATAVPADSIAKPAPAPAQKSVDDATTPSQTHVQPAMPWVDPSTAEAETPDKPVAAEPEKAPEPAAKEPEPAPAKPKRAAEEPDHFREGFLQISVEPSGQVYLDGVYRGYANPALRLSLNAGMHSIEVRSEKYENYTETMHIVAGELSQRTVLLKKLKGIVSLATTEGAELYIDGEFIGTTPIMRPIDVDAGSHTVTIKKENFYTWTSQVTIEANATLPLRITLSPRY